MRSHALYIFFLTSRLSTARPCPFYSQGRCVFAESCGFLHDIKIKSSTASREPTTSSSLDAESCRNSTSSMCSTVKPSLPTSPPSSPSSTHSPRMTSLLSALQGIIGPLSPERAEFPASGGDNPSSDAFDISPLPHNAVQCTDRVSGTPDNVPVQTDPEDVATPACPAVESDPVADPQRDATTPPGLLSPVQIGSVPPVPFPHVALGLGATLSRGDSLDSGYAETWVGPTPFALSPPQVIPRNSTLDLLSSPFGSPLSRVLPRRFSPSPPTRQRTNAPTTRDSIDLISPPVSTTASPIPPPSRTSQDGTSLMYAIHVQQSPRCTHPSGQGAADDADPSKGILGESDSPMVQSGGSPVETLFFPRPPSGIPVLKGPLAAPYDDLVDPQLAGHDISHESPSSKWGEDAASVVEGIIEDCPVSEQPSSAELAELSHIVDALPSSPPSMDTEITSPVVPLKSPISLKTQAEVEELDYEALYQSLVMSPEEAALKRISWASRLSPPTLPPRAASTGSPSAACSTSALVNIPERPHSAVEVRPWSRQWDMGVKPVLASENTSHTSSPFPKTPVSSDSSQADVSESSVHVSPASQSASGLAARSPSTSTSKSSWLPAGNQWPQPPPFSAPLRGVTSTLNNHSESEQARSRWNRVSTSRKVPFGFRRSLVIYQISDSTDSHVDAGGKADRDPSHAVAPKPRKRPSVLTLSSISSIDRYETPSSAQSLSSESSQSKPSWARPLHLVCLCLLVLLAPDHADNIFSLALPKLVFHWQYIVLIHIKDLLPLPHIYLPAHRTFNIIQ